MLLQFIDVLRFMTVGCLTLIIVQLLTSNASKHHVVPASAFAFCALSYLMVDWGPIQSKPVFFLFMLPAVLLSFSFWLCSKSLFDDSFRLRLWMAWALVLVAAVQFLFYFINNSDLIQISESMDPLAKMASQSLSLIFVVLGIVSAARNREADLITARFKFRNVFILLAAVLISITLLSEIAFHTSDTPLWLEFLQKLLIAGLTFVFGFHRLELSPGFFLKTEKISQTAQSNKVDEGLLAQVTDYFENQEIWRTEGLTIRKLAEVMNVKEYRLRQTINQHLGFRNFNDFLNSYRIAYACELLGDRSKKEFTILEIAYEIGYKSISPFNKAFKEIIGMTPTEWRRSKIN